MKFEEVKELLAAGFTADEIRQMAAPQAEVKEEPAKVPEEKPAEVKEEPAKAPEEKDDIAKISDAVSSAIAEGFKQFETIYNKMAKLAGMPSMADVEPKGVEDIITNFFKED